MDKVTVFLNFIPEDRPFAEQLSKELAQTGIKTYFPNEVQTLSDVKDNINAIESVASNDGIMILILDENALVDNRFISNTQYFCEITGKKQNLIICKKGKLPLENEIALYYSRSMMVNSAQKTDTLIQKIILNAKYLLGLETPITIIPKSLNKRVIIPIIWIVAILALAAAIGNYLLDRYNDQQAMAEEMRKAAQAAVVFSEPFTGTTIDQGLNVNYRSLPEYESSENPAQEAPFRFKPLAVHKNVTFTDPQFDNTVNILDIQARYNDINQEDAQLLRQNNGVLQLGCFVPDYRRCQVSANVNHLFTTGNTSYIGVRFRLDDYQGWTNIDKPTFAFIGNEFLTIAGIDLGTQKLFPINGTIDPIFLGTDWHVLEMKINNQNKTGEAFLDGDMVYTIKDIPLREFGTSFGINLMSDYSTEWINIYIDEILIGGNLPIPSAEEPDQAEYHYSVDTIEYYNGFDDSSISQFDQGNAGNYSIADGKLTLSYPPEFNGNSTRFVIPISNISEENYFALKYRITNTSSFYWTYNGSISLKIKNRQHLDSDDGSLFIQSSLNIPEYQLYDGQGLVWAMSDSEENSQIGKWYTIELVIIPPTPNNQKYRMQFWRNNIMLTEVDVSQPETFFANELVLDLSIFSASDFVALQEIEIDEIIVANLPTDQIDQ